MKVLRELRERVKQWLGQGRLHNTRIRRPVLGVLFFVLLTLILSSRIGSQRLDVREGDVAPRDVAAPRNIINKVATEAKREEAAQAIDMVQTPDPDILQNAVDQVNFMFDQITAVGNTQGTLDEQAAELNSKLGLGTAVPAETYAELLEADKSSLAVAREDALRLVQQALTGRVDEKQAETLKSRIDQEQEGYTLVTREPWLKAFVREVVKSQIRPNLVDNPTLTEQYRNAARSGVGEVIWKKGQYIIKKGEPITLEQYKMLEDLRMVGPPTDFRSLFGVAALSLLLVVVMGFYTSRFHPDVAEKESKLLLLGIIGILTLLLCLLVESFQDSLGSGVAYLMPIAMNAMLVSILLDPKISLLQSALLSVVVGMSFPADQLNHIMVALVGSVAGSYAVARMETRADIYRAGLVVSGANVVTILALYMAQAYSMVELSTWLDVGLGALNGPIVAVLVTGALPFFESVFGVVTPLKLLELSNPNHPLLKKLLVEAPGSYHHTILVANLCEAGAQAVGADPMLARVGAYYHDIGKVKRPYFFVENQMGGENPHNKLPPSLSALIITSHVKDGIEMAREAHLPQEVVDFIPEHHGTTLVSYFYYMASKTGGSEYVLEEDFRYEGPKPRSKETAICMLADGCEASVRALRQKGPMTVEHIEGQVRRIVEDRLQQGQLDNCDLTLRDLETLTRTFTKVLSGVHHARVEYPTDEIEGELAEKAGCDGQGSEDTCDAGLDQQRSEEGAPDSESGGDGSTGS